MTDNGFYFGRTELYKKTEYIEKFLLKYNENNITLLESRVNNLEETLNNLGVVNTANTVITGSLDW